MNNTKFWGSKSPKNQIKPQSDISSAATSATPVQVPSTPTTSNAAKPITPQPNLVNNAKMPATTAGINAKLPKTMKKGNKLVKGLGITGVVILLLLLVVGGLGYKFVVEPAVALSSSANRLKDDAKAIGDSMAARDMVALNAALNQTEQDLNNLRNERDTKFSWAKDQKLFKINEFYADSDRFINAGLYGVEALREMSTIVTPFADAAGLKVLPEQAPPQSEGLMEAFQTWVSLMPEVAGKMDTVIEKMDKIGAELEPIDTTKYPEEFRGMPIRYNIELAKNTLSKAGEYGPDIKQALTLFPRALGIGTPIKRYMIIMQNDKEIRPTGGFMTNYATFRMQNGLLVNNDFASKDMYSIDLTLDAIDATYDFPDPPAPYGKFLKVERWYARDMNFSPDLITSMDQFLKFYNMAGRINPAEVKPIDGIVTIDTQVVRELLEVTGPVTVNGVTYSPENVVLELERMASLELREQSNRKKVLGDLMEAMLKNVFESDKNLWPKMIEKGVDLAIRKHIQAYIFDSEVQALVEKYGFGGRIVENYAGDYSLVASTNLGGDKTNWFTSKEVTHQLEKAGDKWMRTVKVKYTYTQPDAEYGPFVKRFRDWVRVYAPAGSEFISVDGSADASMTDQERGKVWFSGFIELEPGESKELVFKYYLPKDAVSADTYKLLIQKQGGIDKEIHRIDVLGKTKEVELSKDTEVVVRL